MFPFPSAPAPQNGTIQDALVSLGLTTNLKVCLDAGASSSYGANTDKWLDLSGNGTDFFKGTGTGADAFDPTFNGNIGNRGINEYFSSDGGDLFTYDTTNETWMNAIHKNGAIWSYCAWFYYPSGAANNSGIFGTCSNVAGFANTGQGCFVSNSTNKQSHFGFNSGATTYSYEQTTTLNTNAWNFIGWSLDENAGGNNTSGITNAATFDSATSYTSPSAGNASFTFQIGSLGNNTRPMVNTSRMAAFGFWQGTKLTAANFTSIYNKTKGRFGL